MHSDNTFYTLDMHTKSTKVLQHITIALLSLFCLLVPLNTQAEEKKENFIMNKEELKKKLSAAQYKVACEGGTEAPFQNEYWDNHREGIYVDIISGEPLFSSKDKFDSGTGWPSFTKPIDSSAVKEHEDRSLGMLRTEVKSTSGAHLGHVFPDGPGPSGQRFCINSASLRFVALENLEKEGYPAFKKLFE